MIPVLCPKPTGKEIKELKRVIASGWWGMGPKTQELEEKFAKLTGAKYAVATNSCTSALDIAVRLIKLPNPVKVSAFTFVSSALSPLNAGYKIKFVDINPKTLCTPKSDIQVMYAGNIAGKGKIYDMAHCGGYKHLGKISCWSFHAVKNLPAGDGGMITMNSKKLHQRAKALSWCGIDKSTFARTKNKYSWDYDIKEAGLKAHMNDITATIALCQLKEIKKNNQYRKRLAKEYFKHLPSSVALPYPSDTWHLFTIRARNRDKLADYLANNGISTGVHYKPLYDYPIFKGKKLPNTEKAFKEILTLPMHCDLKIKDVRHICQLITKFYEYEL